MALQQSIPEFPRASYRSGFSLATLSKALERESKAMLIPLTVNFPIFLVWILDLRAVEVTEVQSVVRGHGFGKSLVMVEALR
jgi:hypothetical protein